MDKRLRTIHVLVSWLHRSLLLCCLLWAGNVAAQEQFDPNAKLFKDYAALTGAWPLQLRCKHLSDHLQEELEWNTAQATFGMRRTGITMPLMLKLQEAGKKIADEQTCGPQAESLLAQSLLLSRRVVTEVGGEPYSPATALKQKAEFLVHLLTADGVEQNCQLMPTDIRAEFKQNLATFESAMSKLVNTEQLQAIRTAAEANLKAARPCDLQIRASLVQALQISRQMAQPR
jgi:hypothetical protein